MLLRLERYPPAGVALGGVIAARHGDPNFDLAGLPRLDLSLHAEGGPWTPERIARLDPALEIGARSDPRTVLVPHPLRRRDPLFERPAGASIPFADPVETLLDLVEMRLIDQADALIRTLNA